MTSIHRRPERDERMHSPPKALQGLVFYSAVSTVFGLTLLVSGFQMQLLGENLMMVCISAPAFALTIWLAVSSYKEVLALLCTRPANIECQSFRNDSEYQPAGERDGIK